MQKVKRIAGQLQSLEIKQIKTTSVVGLDTSIKVFLGFLPTIYMYSICNNSAGFCRRVAAVWWRDTRSPRLRT